MYNLTTDKEKYFCLGKVLKTFGYRGEVVVLIESDDPAKYSDLEMIFIDMDKSLVPWFIEKIDLQGDRAQVKIEDIDRPEDARKLLGRDIYLPLSQLHTLEEEHFYFHEVIGFDVIDQIHGHVGKVAEILDRPEQEIIRIIKDGKDILVPLTDEMITNVDRKNKTLHIDAPQGLIDLYLE
jgi:16S rRNA processing protein RimM